MRWIISIALVAVFAVAGCGDKKKEGDGDKPAATDAGKKPTATPDAAPTASNADAGVEEELPTPEDFEEEAAKEVTEKNLEKELKELEGELTE